MSFLNGSRFRQAFQVFDAAFEVKSRRQRRVVGRKTTGYICIIHRGRASQPDGGEPKKDHDLFFIWQAIVNGRLFPQLTFSFPSVPVYALDASFCKISPVKPLGKSPLRPSRHGKDKGCRNPGTLVSLSPLKRSDSDHFPPLLSSLILLTSGSSMRETSTKRSVRPISCLWMR